MRLSAQMRSKSPGAAAPAAGRGSRPSPPGRAARSACADPGPVTRSQGPAAMRKMGWRSQAGRSPAGHDDQARAPRVRIARSQMDDSDPIAIALVQGIHTGDTAAIAELLRDHPGLVAEHIHGSRSPLHVAADWPGYFPNGPAVVRLLLEAGADPDGGASPDSGDETPLQWAASTNDSE